MNINAAILLDEALMEGIILEDDIESLKDARGNLILDEIVGLITDRDCEWLEHYMDDLHFNEYDPDCFSREAWCEDGDMEYEPITFLGEEDY
jgi:hypothetical protein